MVPPPSTPPNVRLWRGISLGPDVREESAEERGNQFYKEGCYQDAVDAYSLALVYNVSAKTLSNRSQAYIKLEKILLSALSSDEPKIDASKMANYDPLESDSPAYGREFFLGDLNRYLLNNRSPPANPRMKKFRYSVKTWKTAPELSETFCNLAIYARGREDFVEFLQSYIDACVCFDAALKLMFPEGLLLSSAYKSAALDALGFFQRAKKALEPALRLGPQMPQVQICRQALAVKKKDDPKIDPALLDNYDPLAGEGFAYDVRRRVYTGLLKAMEKIYDDEPGPLWPNTSIRELEWHIINEGLRAMRSETFVYAAILLSVVISVSDRTDYALLANRAQAWLHGPLVQNCFCYLLDNYDPLAGEGFAYDVRRRVYTGLLKAMARPSVARGDDARRVRPATSRRRRLKDAHDACDILAVLNEVKGAKCLKEGDVEKALEHLNQALCCGKPPGVLSLRAKALLKSKRYLDAYADAIRAAKYDPTFLEAVELKGQSLAAMGYFTKAHACFREVIKFDPKNDDVRQRMGSIKNKLDRFMEGPFARPGGRGKHRPYLHMRMPLKLLTHCCPV